MPAVISTFCADAALADRFAGARLNHDFDYVATKRWCEFERSYGVSTCAVAAAACLRRNHFSERISDLRRRHVLVTLVVVTKPFAHNLPLLLALDAEETVLLVHGTEPIAEAVARAAGLPVRERLANAIHRLDHVPLDIRLAMAEVCRSASPVHTVARFRAIAGLPRSTLNDQWNRVWGGRPRLRIQDVLHKVELIRACELRSEGLRIAHLPARIGISERTLERRRREAGGMLTGDNGHTIARELLNELRP